MIKLQNLFIFFISVFPFTVSQEPPNTDCNRSCPGGDFSQVSYPFGFSSSCEVQLNCTSNGTVSIGEFPGQQINSDKLLVRLPSTCGRPSNTLNLLYGKHYAPTSTSAILMENCTQQTSNCGLPVPLSQFRSAIMNCSSEGYGNMSCYLSDVRTSMFLDYENVTRLGCLYLSTGFVSERIGGVGPPPSMTQAIKLGWWVKGTCNCSDGADCTVIVSQVDGSDGHRCKCRIGFTGDGYKASSGCLRPQENIDSAIGSIMYAMLGTRPDVSCALSMTSRYQQNPGEKHWMAVKGILKYLRRGAQSKMLH